MASQKHLVKSESQDDSLSTVVNLQQHVDDIRCRELERLFNRLNPNQAEQVLITEMSQRLVERILHQPVLYLKRKSSSGNGDSAHYSEIIRRLFALDHQTDD